MSDLNAFTYELVNFQKLTFLSKITLTLPISLSNLYVKFPKLLCKLIRKSTLADYLYCYDISSSGFHIHLLSTFNYSNNFHILTSAWFRTVRFENFVLSKDYKKTMCHYSAVNSNFEDQLRAIQDLYKDVTNNTQISSIGKLLGFNFKHHVTGSSKRLRPILKKYNLMVSSKKNSDPLLYNLDGICLGPVSVVLQDLYNEYLADYKEDGYTISFDLFSSQFWYELSVFTEFFAYCSNARISRFLNSPSHKEAYLYFELTNYFRKALDTVSWVDLQPRFSLNYFSEEIKDSDIVSILSNFFNSNLRDIFVTILSCLYKTRGLNSVIVHQSLGSLLVWWYRKSHSNIVLSPSLLLRLGHFVFLISSTLVFSKISKYVDITFDELNSFLSFVIPETSAFDFDPSITSFWNSINFFKPMCVRPKKWKLTASINCTGGFLLNGLLIFHPLCNPYFPVNDISILNKINKLQTVAFSINSDLASFYQKNKDILPLFFSSDILDQKQKRLAFLVQELKQEVRLDYVNEKERLQKEISSSFLQNRLLSFALECQSFFYFSYELNLKMQASPYPSEFYLMGSKIIRSLIRLKDPKSFFFEYKYHFSVFTVLQVSPSKLNMFMNFIDHLYTDVYPILYNFSLGNQSLETFLTNVEEPYMYLGCCYEWKRNLSDSKTYKMSMPLDFDCVSILKLNF